MNLITKTFGFSEGHPEEWMRIEFLLDFKAKVFKKKPDLEEIFVTEVYYISLFRPPASERRCAIPLGRGNRFFR